MPPAKKVDTTWPVPGSVLPPARKPPPSAKKPQIRPPQTQTGQHPLAVSLIPAGNWGKNVRSVVARDVWDAMRFYLRSTKTQPSFMRTLGLPPPNPLEPIACSACGAQKNNLELHEHWDYDDTAHPKALGADSHMLEVPQRHPHGARNAIEAGRQGTRPLDGGQPALRSAGATTHRGRFCPLARALAAHLFGYAGFAERISARKLRPPRLAAHAEVLERQSARRHWVGARPAGLHRRRHRRHRNHRADIRPQQKRARRGDRASCP